MFTIFDGIWDTHNFLAYYYNSLSIFDDSTSSLFFGDFKSHVSEEFSLLSFYFCYGHFNVSTTIDLLSEAIRWLEISCITRFNLIHIWKYFNKVFVIYFCFCFCSVFLAVFSNRGIFMFQHGVLKLHLQIFDIRRPQDRRHIVIDLFANI